MASIAEILIAQGRQRADERRRKGELVGQTIASIAQIPAQVLEQRDRQKFADAQAFRQQKLDARADQEFENTQVDRRASVEQKKAERAKQDAVQVVASQYAPDVVAHVLDSWEADGIITKEEGAQLNERITTPEGRKHTFDFIAKITPVAPKVDEPFTLSEGQTRFNPDGTMRATVPKPTPATTPPPVGGFEDYVTRQFGENPTPGQIVFARKLYNQADDRPVDPGLADLNRTLKEQQVQAATDKIEEGKKATAMKRESAVRMAEDLTKVIDTLVDPKTNTLTPGAQSIVGMRVPFAAEVPGSKAADAKASLDRLTGQLVVDLLGEMKAQSKTGSTGFGALSERELAIIQSAATKLTNRNMSEKAFADELKRIRDKVGLVFDGNARPSGTTQERVRVVGPNGEAGTVPKGAELPAGWKLK